MDKITVIATTTIEDITTTLYRDGNLYGVIKNQVRYGQFFNSGLMSLVAATEVYLGCVANEVSLHTDMGAMSQRVITITLPEF